MKKTFHLTVMVAAINLFGCFGQVLIDNSTLVQEVRVVGGNLVPVGGWVESIGQGFRVRSISADESGGSWNLGILMDVQTITPFQPLADVFFSVGGGQFNYGVAFTSHDGLLRGGIYALSGFLPPSEALKFTTEFGFGEYYKSGNVTGVIPVLIDPMRAQLVGLASISTMFLPGGEVEENLVIASGPVASANAFTVAAASAVCGNGFEIVSVPEPEQGKAALVIFGVLALYATFRLWRRDDFR